MRDKRDSEEQKDGNLVAIVLRAKSYVGQDSPVKPG